MINDLNYETYRDFVYSTFSPNNPNYFVVEANEVVNLLGKHEIIPSYQTLKDNNIRIALTPVIMDDGVTKNVETHHYKYGEYPSYDEMEFIYSIFIKKDGYDVRCIMREEYPEGIKQWVNEIFSYNLDIFAKLCHAVKSKELIIQTYKGTSFKNQTLFESLHMVNDYIEHFIVEVEMDDGIPLIFDDFNDMEFHSEYLISHNCRFEIRFNDFKLPTS